MSKNKYWHLNPEYKSVQKTFDEARKYDSVNYYDLDKVWKDTHTDWKQRSDEIIFPPLSSGMRFLNTLLNLLGFPRYNVWIRYYYLTKSRSGKKTQYVVYFESEKTGERIYRNFSPFDRG
jgi:hypothetical protein